MVINLIAPGLQLDGCNGQEFRASSGPLQLCSTPLLSSHNRRDGTDRRYGPLSLSDQSTQTGTPEQAYASIFPLATFFSSHAMLPASPPTYIPRSKSLGRRRVRGIIRIVHGKRQTGPCAVVCVAGVLHVDLCLLLQALRDSPGAVICCHVPAFTRMTSTCEFPLSLL